MKTYEAPRLAVVRLMNNDIVVTDMPIASTVAPDAGNKGDGNSVTFPGSGMDGGTDLGGDLGLGQ